MQQYTLYTHNTIKIYKQQTNRKYIHLIQYKNSYNYLHISQSQRQYLYQHQTTYLIQYQKQKNPYNVQHQTQHQYNYHPQYQNKYQHPQHIQKSRYHYQPLTHNQYQHKHHLQYQSKHQQPLQHQKPISTLSKVLVTNIWKIHKTYKNKINSILTKMPTNIQMDNIQSKIKIKQKTKSRENNKQTNEKPTNIHTKYPIKHHKKYHMSSAYRPRHKKQPTKYLHLHKLNHIFKTIIKSLHKRKNKKVLISTTNTIEKLEPKKQTIKYITNHNKHETKNPKEIYQLKVTNYQNLKIQKTNKTHNNNTTKIVSNTKTNELQHKYHKVILTTLQKIQVKKLNTTFNNTLIQPQIQTKTTPLTKQVKSSNQTNNTTINNHTKYHQRIPYTHGRGGLFTLEEIKTASAPRPRHKIKNKYQFTNNWKPNTITNHTPKDNTNTHFSTKQQANITPALPNLFTTTKFILIKYLKTNKQNPKILQLHGYYFINKLALLQCGDIEPNPGPMPNILRTHPVTHKKRAKTYFIPNTIKLQLEYQHIASTFAPILRNTHPLHHQTTITYPHLHQNIETQRNSPPTHILYALIITINPLIDTCNNILAQPHIYQFNNIWTNTLIIRLANLNNPPERHILTQHPYSIFVENNQDIIHPKNSIHIELYKFIHNQETPPTPITLQKKFPFLLVKLITKSLRCLENINEYSHSPTLPDIPTPAPRIITNTNQETNIITWNASSLNTALPNLQSLINHSPINTVIINIQETKLTATKSTKYIENLFPNYKLIFNNTHVLTRCIQQRMPYTHGRGGLLTLIHNKYAFPSNVTKIPTPSNISLYLQIIKINNHPLLPWLIIHIYMPTHLDDIHLISYLKTTISNRITAHPNHTHILCGDFNRDIALTGRQNNNNNIPPQEEDIQRKNFTTTLNLEYIPTDINISRQGGYNYTSTSLIDGFYINSPNNNKFISTTNTNMNINSDHYPITLHIPQNILIARPPPPENITPTRILNPIPPENLEKFNIKFFEANSTQINELTNLLENHNHLTSDQWQEVCIALDKIVEKISVTIEKTCKTAPTPTLTNKTTQQGGFLPRKLSKEWKKHLETYHLIRKTIYIAKNNPH